MTGPTRIIVHIDRLRVPGASPAQAQQIADALRHSLRAQLAADPAAVTGMARDRMQITAPATHATARGHAIGTGIGAALTRPKRGTG